MAKINTNIITLALKNKLIGAILTLDDDSTLTVVDFEYDPRTDIFVVEDTAGERTPVHASKMGLAESAGLTKPKGNRKKVKKLK